MSGVPEASGVGERGERGERAGEGGLFWCHQCNQTVRPSAGDDVICPFCHGGFVEEITDEGGAAFGRMNVLQFGGGGEREQEREREREREREGAPSPSPFVAAGGDARMARRPRGYGMGGAGGGAGGRLIGEGVGVGAGAGAGGGAGGTGPAALLEAMHAIMAQLQTVQQAGAGGGGGGGEGAPPNPMLMMQAQMRQLFNGHLEVYVDSGNGQGARRLQGNLSDYFLGPGFEQLLQQLAENDPNKYGTPPASKSAVEAMPHVVISVEHTRSDTSQCAVCKDEFEIGTTVRQMACMHMYHPECILPWLEQHNSCPVCRYEMVTDDAEYEARRAGGAGEEGREREGERGTGRAPVWRRLDRQREGGRSGRTGTAGIFGGAGGGGGVGVGGSRLESPGENSGGEGAAGNAQLRGASEHSSVWAMGGNAMSAGGSESSDGSVSGGGGGSAGPQLFNSGFGAGVGREAGGGGGGGGVGGRPNPSQGMLSWLWPRSASRQSNEQQQRQEQRNSPLHRDMERSLDQMMQGSNVRRMPLDAQWFSSEPQEQQRQEGEQQRFSAPEASVPPPSHPLQQPLPYPLPGVSVSLAWHQSPASRSEQRSQLERQRASAREQALSQPISRHQPSRQAPLSLRTYQVEGEGEGGGGGEGERERERERGAEGGESEGGRRSF